MKELKSISLTKEAEQKLMKKDPTGVRDLWYTVRRKGRERKAGAFFEVLAFREKKRMESANGRVICPKSLTQ